MTAGVNINHMNAVWENTTLEQPVGQNSNSEL